MAAAGASVRSKRLAVDVVNAPDIEASALQGLVALAHDRGSAVAAWSANATTTTCSVGWPGARPRLSEVLPLFAHLGLELLDHRPVAAPVGGGDVFTFQPLLVDDAHRALELLGEAFGAAWERLVDRDDFARLVPAVGLHARQVQLLRAAFHYLRQAHLGVSRPYVRDILVAYPAFARQWVEVFEATFDPRRPPGPAVEHDLDSAADAAATRDEYHVLQWYAGLLRAVVRTSYARADADDGRAPTITLKIDPSRLPFETDPQVVTETFVHHPDVEGLHVRYGRIARGGLRWSDRLEDYRDEVVALAKAQQVKNCAVVPAGAKGAFVGEGAAGRDGPGRRGASGAALLPDLRARTARRHRHHGRGAAAVACRVRAARRA